MKSLEIVEQVMVLLLAGVAIVSFFQLTVTDYERGEQWKVYRPGTTAGREEDKLLQWSTDRLCWLGGLLLSLLGIEVMFAARAGIVWSALTLYTICSLGAFAGWFILIQERRELKIATLGQRRGSAYRFFVQARHLLLLVSVFFGILAFAYARRVWWPS